MDEYLGLKYKGTITLNLFRGAEIETLPDGRHRHVPGTGELVHTLTQPNVFLNVGKSWAIQRLFDDTSAVVSGTAAQCFYVGTTTSGGTGAVAGDTTAANTEIARENFVYASGAVGAMSATATFVSATANGALTEAGIFAGVVTTSGDGVFVVRVRFNPVNKTAADTVQLKWDIALS